METKEKKSRIGYVTCTLKKKDLEALLKWSEKLDYTKTEVLRACLMDVLYNKKKKDHIAESLKERYFKPSDKLSIL